MHFTFKNTSDKCYIEYNKKQVGYIEDELPYRIKLMVMKKDPNEDKHPDLTWKWVTFTKESSSLIEAQDYLNSMIESITDRYELYLDY